MTRIEIASVVIAIILFALELIIAERMMKQRSTKMDLYRIKVNGVDTGVELDAFQESIYNQGFVDGMEHMRRKALDCAKNIFDERQVKSDE